jgi:3-polyprenyl-4-hydroxybenzoate decarboxylase
VDDLVSHTVARVLERLGLPHEPLPEWTGGGRAP